MYTNYKLPIQSFNTYNTNQTTLGEHAHGKQCWPAPRLGRPQEGRLIWKGPAHMENIEKILRINIIGWHLSRLV